MVAVVSFGSSAHAFDNNRKGFVFGMGVGPAHVSNSAAQYESVTGILTDLVIGAGINEQTLIYYGGKHFWFRDAERLHSMGHPSIVLRRYLKPESPSAYFSGGMGAAVGLIHGSSYTDIRAGISLQASAGYEFMKNVDVRGSVIWTHLAVYNVSTWTIAATVNVLGY